MDDIVVMMHELVIGGGCFWCLEAVYQRVKGVREVIPGYAGGHVENPDYGSVCNGGTGHAEVVKVIFDDDRIGMDDILRLFFAMHDPTTLDRQGNDIGNQYRSIILYADDLQKQKAGDAMQEWRDENPRKTMVTELEPLGVFHPAEAYHHRYFERNSRQPYCRMVVEPKLQKMLQGKYQSMME